MFRLLSVAVLAIMLTGCAGVSVSDYADREPTFDPLVFFNGPLQAQGVVFSRSGEVRRHFTATIDARWNADGGVLDEVFQWSDGERQTRVWRFERDGERSYVGRAGDVKGTAQMRYAGNAVNMNYRLLVPLSSGRTIAVSMDDWLYQVDANTLINVTDMSKFGFDVGQVVLTMRKL
ncbi:DUF3833 domain-containing protein [Saccharospirillum sp. MSK14-1]|uniref:DUF3833 domain-containing protein n=1 Tax=Saccharospirillum sp. MSK14-1 TaxID=1897632 RepID=UPI0018EE9EA1|nr:DUF3833 domain-containing protein [Saccharospirillum sp. MSK14-1]